MAFFAIGLLQAASFQVAARLTGRIGLLKTMVFTHLPSNILLAAVAFAPNLATALVLLFARFALSQMDVPARQAYVMALVTPAGADGRSRVHERGALRLAAAGAGGCRGGGVGVSRLSLPRRGRGEEPSTTSRST